MIDLNIGSAGEFFHEAVTRALRSQGVESSAPTECYLVRLLSEFITQPIPDEALSVKLALATTATPQERVRQLRDVGDTTLYVTGFFAESLNRRLVDVEYYIELGESAYAQLARHYRGEPAFSDVYLELNENFVRYVDVLAEVSEHSHLSTDTGVVYLYERWLKTGSESTARRLRQRGLLPRKGEDHS